MLPTIQLDNHSPLETHEIDNVLSNGLLTAKLAPTQLALSKVPP